MCNLYKRKWCKCNACFKYVMFYEFLNCEMYNWIEFIFKKIDY